MRVLLFLPSLGAGGAERVVSRLANAWAARGWEVSVVTLAATGTDFFPLDPAVRRVGLDALAESAHLLDAVAGNLRRLLRVRRAVADCRPEVVVSFCDRNNVLALLATRGLPCPVVVSERVDPSRHEAGAVWSRLRRLVYPWAAAVVVQTEEVRAWMRREIPTARTVVVPNPVFPVERHPVERSGAGPVLVAMGRLSHQKGFDRLLEAFAALEGRFPDWRLEIIGDGESRAALVAQAGNLGLAGRVAFAGRLADPYPRLARADLFVLSSRYEGFPNALLEAMACGLPVVAFDCPSGPAAIIRHGVDGLLVPAGDVSALADALAALMADAARRQALGANARAVLERFGPERVLDQWETLLAGVAGRGRDELAKPGA